MANPAYTPEQEQRLRARAAEYAEQLIAQGCERSAALARAHAAYFPANTGSSVEPLGQEPLRVVSRSAMRELLEEIAAPRSQTLAVDAQLKSGEVTADAQLRRRARERARVAAAARAAASATTTPEAANAP